ncbi:type VII secretion system-associated protein [Streptomyces sp. NPDC058579]|uniref:type VII secretion system-associated protein n=1 Tax=Streptomyces sp. NPDC058579 TaxID=3346548 RepID=UPI00364BCDE2
MNDAALPPVPDDVREAARLAPDHWLGMVDPGWRGEGAPPRWALVGEWRSAPDGEVAEWQANDEYRPSPQALGWPAPTDPVDEAVQLAVTGYGRWEDAVRALAAAEVSVLHAPDGEPLLPAGPDGRPTVPVFTAEPHQPFAGVLTHRSLPAADLARSLAAEGALLAVNPAGPARLTVPAQDVVSAAPVPSNPGASS